MWNADENEICTCKSKMSRTATWDPEVGECSVMSLVDKWHRDMLASGPPGGGCHEIEYPDSDWTEVDCVEAPTASKRAHGKRTGDECSDENIAENLVGECEPEDYDGDYDFAVSASSGETLGKVTGSFTGDLDSVTSMTDGGMRMPSVPPAAIAPDDSRAS